MPTHATRLALLVGLSACSMHNRPVEQISVTHTRTQDALVMAPEAPVGFGRQLTPGMTSLSAIGGLTGTQAPTGDVGQHAIPVSGGLRGAAGASKGVEVTVSGTVGSPSIDPGLVADTPSQPEGILGRGAVGLRGFIPTSSAVDIGMSFDIGAEASSYAQTDRVVITHRDRSGVDENSTSDTSYDLLIKPHVRSAMMVRAPLPGLPVSVVGGAQVQNWTVYWAEASRTDTCTTYTSGDTTCITTGSIPDKPTKQVALFTPTAGASFTTDVADFHVQGFVHLGPDAAQGVPWGGMIAIELFGKPSQEDDQLAQNSVP